MIDHVYFMLDIDAWEIKIGRAIDPQHRIREIRRERGTEIVLLATIDYDAPTNDENKLVNFAREVALHKEFAHLRIGTTEWFRPAPDLWERIGREKGKELAKRVIDVSELPPRLQAFVPLSQRNGKVLIAIKRLDTE